MDTHQCNHFLTVRTQVQWKGEYYQHGDPGYQNALWICPKCSVFKDGGLLQLLAE